MFKPTQACCNWSSVIWHETSGRWQRSWTRRGVQCTGDSPVFAMVSLTETAWKFGEHNATQITSQRRRETITHVNKSVTKWLSDSAERIASSAGGVMLIWGKDDRNASLLYLSWFVFWKDDEKAVMFWLCYGFRFKISWTGVFVRLNKKPPGIKSFSAMIQFDQCR